MKADPLDSSLADRRLLLIGDSHTCGPYGKTLDQACRDAGAIVRSYGSCSSHPIWWFDGTRTHCGYFARDERGRISRVPFGELRRTPKIATIHAQFKPDLTIVSLGANMVDYSKDTVQSTSAKLAAWIRAHGSELVWVGPPVIRLQPRWKLDRLYGWLRAAVEPYGPFIDSRPWTWYPETGGDGIHYRGAAGRPIAENWARQVFERIQAELQPLPTSSA